MYDILVWYQNNSATFYTQHFIYVAMLVWLDVCGNDFALFIQMIKWT